MNREQRAAHNETMKRVRQLVPYEKDIRVSEEKKKYSDEGTETELKVWDNAEGFTIEWSVKELGFGELTFFTKNGKWQCNTECMTGEFVEHIVRHWLKQVKLNHV